MRILAMVHAYPPIHNAGGEMTMHALLRHLASRGHDVHVQLSESVTGDYDLDGIRVHPYRDARDPIPFFNGPGRADVVIAHLQNTLRAAALCGIYGVPLVQLIHNNHEFTKGALRRGPCHLAVFNSHWMHDDFAVYWRRHNRAAMPRSVVVHPPVDPALYATTHGKRITLINLFKEKGGELFWRLARELPEREFLGVRGAYGDQVIPPDVDWPLNVEVIAHQRPDDMAKQVYSETKVLLMPSSYESYGRVAIEAAHSGIPTIAHPTPGLREALGEAGTFVDRDDLAGWVAAIKYLTSPRGFSAASAKAKAHAQSLTPTADLDRFADAMEGVPRRAFATTTR